MNNDRFKFRVWDFPTDNNTSWENKYTYFDLMEMGDDEWSSINNQHQILEQCTGLKDKNGKLIYEGDCFIYPIIPSDDCEGFLEEEKCYVKWFANSFCLVSMKTDEYIGGVCNCKKLKIISNIRIYWWSL